MINEARLRTVAVVFFALAAPACQGAPAPEAAAAAEPVAADPTELMSQEAPDTVQQIAAALAANLPSHSDGARLVESVCVACHSLAPPPELAPPLNMVVRHYMEEFDDPAEAQAAIATWIVAPNPEVSGLPDHAIERFGIMPPIPLTQVQRDAVAAYLVEEFGDAGMGGHMGDGMEGQMGDGGEGHMQGMQGPMRERMRRRGGN